jgi:formamidopyrimidine-DNA glycosylase
MPELPEVETVVRTLETLILNMTIMNVSIFTPSIVYHNTNFKSQVINQEIVKLSRRGKYILIIFNEGTLVVHLRMEGRFFINHSFEQANKHVHVSFLLDDGRVLHYQDTRKFGRMMVVNDVNQALSHIGLEYDDPHFTPQVLSEKMRKSHRSLKAFLLSQGVICGLGNIYVDEVCFRSRVHPLTKVNTLTLQEVTTIHSMIYLVLTQAIALGGSSIRTYTNAMGIDGRFQLQLQVHMRQGQPCIICSTPIIKTVIANRGTYLCPQCQKELKLD